MASHVEIVGLLFVIWGALTMLVGLSTLALGVGAIAIITSAVHGSGSGVAAQLTAGAFMTLAVIAILWGLAHVVTGLPLRQKRHWTRTAALMLAAVDIILLPYGTALGAYALWVLLSAKSKALFEMPGASVSA
jgi:hypothetical protein